MIIGGEDGVLSLLDPGANEKEPLLLEQQIGRPIIDIEVGEFLPTSGPIMAVLTSQDLSYFKLNYDTSDLSRTQIGELFSHEMTEPAYNMCLVPSQTTHQILVQSVGCVLTLYQGEQCVFSRSPLPALHPAPLSYCYPTSSLVTSNGGRLHSVKFSLLAGLGNSGKKVTFDWSFNLGDTCIDIAMEDTPSVPASIICLCRYAVYCLTTGGTVRWQIRLETVGTALMVYSTGKESLSIRFCVATSANALLVFADNKLMWNCQTEGTIVAIKLSNYNSVYQSVLSTLSTEGRISIGYLGTEPNLYKVLVDNRYVDFKAKIEEMRELEASIKDIGTVGAGKTSAFVMKCIPGELEKATVELNAKNGAPVCPLTVSVEGIEAACSVKVNIRSTLQTSSRQFVIERPGDGGSIKIPFFVGDLMPASTTVHLAAHCCETQATTFLSVRLPLAAMFAEAAPERNASYKLTLDSDGPCMNLNILFHGQFQTENPTSIGFRVHGYNATAAIFTANKSNRYRIQTDYPHLLNVIATELMDRLRHAEGSFHLHANIPMSYITTKLEELIELESNASVEEKTITNRSREMRAIETLVLHRTATTKPETFQNIDLLYNDAHDQLLVAIDELSSIRVRIQETQLALSSLLDLVALLLSVDGTESVLNGHFITDTTQGIEERLSWASQVSGDPPRAVTVLCQHTKRYLPQITENEKETNNCDSLQEGEIKS